MSTAATMETLKSALPAIFDTYTYDMSNREGEAFTCYGETMFPKHARGGVRVVMWANAEPGRIEVSSPIIDGALSSDDVCSMDAASARELASMLEAAADFAEKLTQ
ncbi:hypothetical protein QEV67_02805 [Trueperella pyogenes]|uniref:hypothetical protein n=1 Tax=Trueperella pyogenes TaxID=1661 RepID=UPI00046AF9D3|nr:hypothetical protein [Trueperella pyogenes]